jgi:predicted transcriptional regulator/DNA-binding Lrp family transcriptional regulator
LTKPIVNLVASTLAKLDINPNIFGGSSVNFGTINKKAYNEFLILACLKDNNEKDVTKTEIIKKIGLNRSRLYEIIIELLKYGLVQESISKENRLFCPQYRITDKGSVFLQTLKTVVDYCKDPIGFAQNNDIYKLFLKPDVDALNKLIDDYPVKLNKERIYDEKKIFNAILENFDIEFSRLIEVNGFGSAKLRSRLKNLERRGLVKFRIQNFPGNSYKKFYNVPYGASYTSTYCKEKILDRIIRSQKAITLESIAKNYGISLQEVVGILMDLSKRGVKTIIYKGTQYLYFREKQFEILTQPPISKLNANCERVETKGVYREKTEEVNCIKPIKIKKERPSPQVKNTKSIVRVKHESPKELIENSKPTKDLKPTSPSEQANVKKELWVKIGPYGQSWIDSGIGYGPGTTSKSLLLALQKHGDMKFTDLISYDVFIPENEEGINFLRELELRKAVKLYEKQVS